jgi:hypothetical protein
MHQPRPVTDLTSIDTRNGHVIHVSRGLAFALAAQVALSGCFRSHDIATDAAADADHDLRPCVAAGGHCQAPDLPCAEGFAFGGYDMCGDVDNNACCLRAPTANCERWCDDRLPKEDTEGWCPLDGWSAESRSCSEACQDWSRAAPIEFVRECVEEEPLCFVSMEQCLEGKERRSNCLQWCSYRDDEHATDGFCDPVIMGSPDRDCESVCIRALIEDLEDVESCIKDAPLCFENLTTCATS